MSSIWYGSLQNRIEEWARMPEPEVGMGVTELCYTDRHPYEIIEVKDSRHITVRRLDHKRIDNNGISESQDYEYSSNPNNPVATLFKTKDGKWVERIGKRYGCNGWKLGKAEEYYDFSF